MTDFLSKLDLSVRFHASRGEAHMSSYLRNQLDTLKNVSMEKKKYLATSYYVPGELLELFGAEVVYMERLAGLAAAWRIMENPVSRTQAQGFPPRGCSYQALFHLLLEEAILPRPAGFAALSYACGNAWEYCRSAAEKYQTPFYSVDVPNSRGDGARENLAKRLEELYERLKRDFPIKTGREEVVAASNRALKIKSEIDAFRLQNPGRGNIIDFLKLFPLYNDLGKKSTAEILRLFKQKLEKSPAAGSNGEITGILWLGIVPLYRNSLISDIEKKLECRAVCEEMFDFGNTELTCGNFFGDLAQRILSSRFFTPESRVRAIFKDAEDFKAKGIIHFSQRNCGFLPPAVSLIRKRAEEEKIPFVELRGDAVDPGYFDEKAAWELLEPFYEQIHGR